MEAGVSVWCRDQKGEEAWILADVIKREADKLTLRPRDNSKPIFTRGIESRDPITGETKFDGVELANTVLVSDDEQHEGRDNDLITLPHLHEPAILHALSERFFRGKIYTWTGPVLIAVNPYQRLVLYTEEILEQYRHDGLLKAQGMQTDEQQLEPHVFAIADRAYRQMMSEARKSQSILISGESGAGKTESTKIVMLYLTTLGAGDEDTFEGEFSIMQKVLQSNPILGAFGNARTLRNDNSSRFGKFIELGFNHAGHLKGARVQTYLLEKVRLAFHAAGERNYHIFYQLLRGCKEEEHAKYEFHEGITGGLDLPNYFHYTGQGGAPHLREFTDEYGYEHTKKAMQWLRWSEDTIDQVFCIVAGLLHLGQITFNSVEKDGMETADIGDETTLEYSSRLLGVDMNRLRLALTERIIVARGQEITTQLTPERAADARDALAKTVYESLFLWIVDQVNQSIGWENDSDIKSSCGVLDIFGFECFAINSFEQLCINYTNEALQQQFNQFIFKLEQAEYEAEKIEWAFIEFPDNQDCLDTIQAPKVGILSMLDDECRLPDGSEKNWSMRMYDQWIPPGKDTTASDNTRFHATNVQKAKSIFCVRHFAGIVEYRAETSFMEKNKDEIPLTAVQMFETAPSQLIKDTYAVQTRENIGRLASDASGKQAKRKTVGQQFKEQLTSLIENVQKTDPHYIRCIKPNDAAKPMRLTRKRMTEQLRYGGVLEAVRVARASYPVRMSHEAFYKRYRVLLPATPESILPWAFDEDKTRQLCTKLVEVALSEGKKQSEATKAGSLHPHEDGITRSELIRYMHHIQPLPMLFPKTDVQIGLTKVFMRRHPHDCLEAHLVFHRRAIAIQSWARGLVIQRKYWIQRSAVEMIQRYYRGSQGRERWRLLREGSAGDLLTNNFRMLIKWRAYNRARRGTIMLQGAIREHNVRKVMATLVVQRYYRKYIAQKKFRMRKSATISLQCAIRARIATNALVKLKKEHKTVDKLKNDNLKLREEMTRLRAMLSAQATESSVRAAHAKELKVKDDRIAELEKQITEMKKELEDTKATLNQTIIQMCSVRHKD